MLSARSESLLKKAWEQFLVSNHSCQPLNKACFKEEEEVYWQKENHNSVSLVGKEVTVKNIELCLCVLLCHIL